MTTARPFPDTPPAYLADLVKRHPELAKVNRDALSGIAKAPPTTIKATITDIDLQEVERFLSRLCGGAIRTFQTFADREEDRCKPGYAKHFNNNPAAMAELVRMNTKGAGAFVMVNEGDGKGRSAKNVIKVRSVFVDLDGSPLEPVIQAGLEPHITVESSPGRFHAYYLVDDCPLEKFQHVQKALAEKFDGDKNVNDLPRVMRIPGFLHQKAKKGQDPNPFLSRIISVCDVNSYSFSDIVDTLGLRIDSDNGPSPVGLSQGRHESHGLGSKSLVAALSFIDPDPYDNWVSVGMALKNEFGDKGVDEWLQWSSKSEKFDAAISRKKWETFCRRESGSKVMGGTIIKMARDSGWIPEGTEPDDNSDSGKSAIIRLSKLSAIEYDKVRKDEALALGVRTGTLDELVGAARKGDVFSDLPFEAVEPWESSVDGAELLTTLMSTVRRFIVCEVETAQAVALWITMTWFMDVVQVAPLAVITAPEKRCGKSMLLSLISKLVYRALISSSISPAALYRSIEAWKPTLLIDETDACLKDNEELRGLINSGHTRDSAYVIRCEGDNHEPKMYSTWGAKALSGIGHVADTLMDRSIILDLRRKLPNENVERIRHSERGLFRKLCSKLARFAEDNRESVRVARPDLPLGLNDRAQDNWEPLLAIATVAGGEWPKIGTAAALKISGGESLSLSIGTELLADIQEIFERRRTDRISSADMIKDLCADDEKPWATFNKGFPIKPRQIAARLKGFGVHSKTIRIGSGVTPKGYEINQFKDVFTRYLSPSTPATTPQPSINGASGVAD